MIFISVIIFCNSVHDTFVFICILQIVAMLFVVGTWLAFNGLEVESGMFDEVFYFEN